MKKPENLNKSWKIFIFVIVFLAGFLVNICFHELGHYAAADFFELNPEIEFAGVDDITNFNMFSLKGNSVAVTIFDDPNDNLKTGIIAGFGPLVNLIFVELFVLLFLIYRRNNIAKMICYGGLIPSLISFIMNILPVGLTDGAVLLNLIV